MIGWWERLLLILIKEGVFFLECGMRKSILPYSDLVLSAWRFYKIVNSLNIFLKNIHQIQKIGISLSTSPLRDGFFDATVSNVDEVWQLKIDSIYKPVPIILGAKVDLDATKIERKMSNSSPAFGYRKLEPSLMMNILKKLTQEQQINANKEPDINNYINSVLGSLETVAPVSGGKYLTAFCLLLEIPRVLMNIKNKLPKNSLLSYVKIWSISTRPTVSVNIILASQLLWEYALHYLSHILTIEPIEDPSQDHHSVGYWYTKDTGSDNGLGRDCYNALARVLSQNRGNAIIICDYVTSMTFRRLSGARRFRYVQVIDLIIQYHSKIWLETTCYAPW